MIKMKRTNVKKHTRKIKGKKVKVRKHRRKTKAKISKDKRKVMTAIANTPLEKGGYMDFEKEGLQNLKLNFGDDFEVEFEDNPDYEVEWHTHPPLKYSSIHPSYEDIESMQDAGTKEQIIFLKNKAISLNRLNGFGTVKKSVIRNVSNMMDRDLRSGKTDLQVFRKYKPLFRDRLKLGMRWHRPNNEIVLATEVR
jgi:hypothetical protein